MNQCMKCGASIPLASTSCLQCGWQFKILGNDPLSDVGLSIDGKWAVSTHKTMRRFCYVQAILFLLSFNLVFLYYYWIAAEYGRDPSRAAWHLILLSWIMAVPSFLVTGLLMYYYGKGDILYLKINSIKWDNVWPIVVLVLGLAITLFYAIPIISRYRFRSEFRSISSRIEDSRQRVRNVY